MHSFDTDPTAVAYITARGRAGVTDRALLDALGDVVHRAPIVLDLGCGDGRIALQVIARGARRVIALDRSRDMLRHALVRVATTNAIHLVEGDACALPTE